MSEEASIEELREIIKDKKVELENIKSESKIKEKTLQAEVEILNREKTDLMAGVQARIQLVDMLKRDIVRMAYEETARIAQNEFDHPPAAK